MGSHVDELVCGIVVAAFGSPSHLKRVFPPAVVANNRGVGRGPSAVRA
eukprot:CAMPEP_0206322250 /NCGR_PEP_ID=MMETSP0106_2-20121207/19325_1 /ASSEMBLY_ACC=CAM_ASM_000206 /TAXON_ID=81532 /ORGANISM="Acanthoeca-like sp., Strain 10tr" /LENGTH=47 /DNA_ID= /DNA_START= /DNA_END= /DNA_ORIENTATION=